MFACLALALVVAADPPKQVEIIVTEAESNKPLEKAVIRIFNNIRPTPYAFTDAAGKATIDYPASGELTLDIHTNNHIQKRVAFPETRPRPAQFAVKLRKGERTVGGLVVDEAGKPIAGASVRFSAYLGKPKRTPEGVDLVCDIDALTDAQGRWQLKVVDETPNNFHFDVKHPDFVYLWSHKPVAAELLAGTAKVMLKRGVAIRGKVVDEQGKPVVGAAVVGVSGRVPLIDFTPRVVTGPDGAFRFTFEHGRNTLMVQAAGRSPAFKIFERLEKPTEFTFTLLPGRHVVGRVVDSAGRPVAGAYVAASFPGGRYIGVAVPTLRLGTTSGADGAFELVDAPADAFLLSATKKGYLFSEGSTLSPGKKEAKLVLKQGPKLNGSVVDAATGKPIPEFTVAFNFCGLDNSSGKPLPAQFGFNRHFEETKGKDGRFELTHGQTLDRPAQVAAWAPGYKLARSEPFPNDGKDHDFTFKLEKENRTPLAGVVKLPDGRPAAGAVVLKATRADAGASFVNGAVGFEARTDAWRRCDEQGRFSFPPKDDEPFVLGASHAAGWATWEPTRDAKTNALEITLIPWATIKGTFLLDGKPSSGAEIAFRADRPAYIEEKRLEVEFRAETKTDSKGGFTLQRVPSQPGRVFRFVNFGGGGGPYVMLAAVSPKSNQTIDLGDARQQGRTIIGRLKLPPSLKENVADPNAPTYVCTGTECQATSDRPWTPFPAELNGKSQQERSEWLMKWVKTPEAREYHRNYHRHLVWLGPDGRFRIEGAKPGALVLKMPLRAATSDGERGDLLATVTKHFEVPPMPKGYEDMPLDLGEIDVVESKVVRLGQKMPEITASTLDGKEWKSSSSSGKVRVLDFWASWCGPCIQAMPTMAALHEELGGKGLEIVGLSVDAERSDAAALVEKKKCTWRQVHLGAKSTASRLLGIEAIPTFFVLDRDGTVLYRGTAPNAAANAARAALAK